jgi:UDP-N-acetylmuramoylalanine--D-glutamate ligase
MRPADLAGKRVGVWGCGREGQAALAALRARLPGQRVGLFCSEGEAAGLADRGGLDLLGTAPDADALAAFDVVVKSPGISAYRPELLAAAARGTRFVSGTALWFGEHPGARVIAVTGTKGKSTVASLVAHCLRALGRRTALAGNIGMPLLELLDPPQAPDWWVVELSSFQTREPPAVDVAVVNNLYEEHLDWHGTRALRRRQARAGRRRTHAGAQLDATRADRTHRRASTPDRLRRCRRLACRRRRGAPRYAHRAAAGGAAAGRRAQRAQRVGRAGRGGSGR